MAERAVATIDQPTEIPACSWSQRKSAGVVRMATNVAARRRARH
jgi:hypothetical protein